jgi:hypothetical protein
MDGCRGELFAGLWEFSYLVMGPGVSACMQVRRGGGWKPELSALAREGVEDDVWDEWMDGWMECCRRVRMAAGSRPPSQDVMLDR